MAKTRFFSIAGGKVKRIRNRIGDSGHHFTVNVDTNSKRARLESERSNISICDISSDTDDILADSGNPNRIDIIIAKPDNSYQYLKGFFFKNSMGQCSFIMP